MKVIPVIIASACLLFLCSCATVTPPSPVIVKTPIAAATQLPPSQDINIDAGRGGLLFVNIGLGDGEKFPFIVDTGCPITIFDKSLEPKLGKCLDTGTFHNFGSDGDLRVYAAPQIYLGGVPLMTATNVFTLDLKKMRYKDGPRFMGILGMDCMKHYCIQLDFKGRQMRFLDPNHFNTNRLGKAYPIVFSTEGQDETNLYCPYIQYSTLFGQEVTNLIVDVGCNMDGGIDPRHFRQEARIQGVRVERTRFNSGKADSATFRDLTWSGQTYTNLTFRTWPARVGWSDLIGLAFLARHLVTFDFPGRMMYLKQRSVGTLDDQLRYSVVEFLTKQKRKGRVPGWAKNEHGKVDVQFDDSNPDAFDCQARKNGDPALYHYRVTRKSGDSPWKLVKAWQTNAKGKVIKEFTIQ